MVNSNKSSLPSDVATKADLAAMEKRMGSKFASKQDLVTLKTELKQTLKEMVTKDELEIKFTNFGREMDEKLDEKFKTFKTDFKNELTNDIVEGVNQDLRDLLGPHLDIVDSHDGRIKTLERHTSHPPLAQAIA